MIASPGDRAGLEAAFEEFGSAIAFGAGGSGGFFSATISLDTAIEQSLGSVLVGTPVNTLVSLVGDSFDGSEMVAFIPEPDVAAFAGIASLLMILRRFRRRR